METWRFVRARVLLALILSALGAGVDIAQAGDPALIGTQRFRPGSLDRLALSADGRVLVSAGGSELAVWDPDSGRRRQRFETSSGLMSLSADGRWVVGLDFSFLGSALVVRDVASGKVRTRWPCETTGIDRLALNRDGSILATAQDAGGIALRRQGGGAPGRLPGEKGALRALLFSPTDAGLLAAGGEKGALKLWDLAQGEGQARTLSAGEKTIMALAFSADGQILAAADSAGWVYLYRVGDGSQTAKFAALIPGEPSELRGVAVSPAGDRVAVGTWSGVIALFEVAGPRLVAVLAEGGLVAAALAMTPDGRRVIGGVSGGALRRWDAETGAEVAQPEAGNLAGADRMVWTPDPRRVVVAAGGRAPQIWDLSIRKPVAELPGHTRRVRQLAASAGGTRLASGGNDGWVRLWDGRSLKEIRAVQNHASDVAALALSPDGKQLASGARRGALVVRDADSFEILFERPEDDAEDMIVALAFSADGRLLLSGDTMGEVVWLDLATGAPLAINGDAYPSNIRSIAFSPDGKLVATSASDKVRVYDAASASLLVTFGAPGWSTSNAVWFPDSRRLAFADTDGHLWLAEAVSGRVRRAAAGDGLKIEALVLRPDGQELLTAQRDTTLRIWDPARLPRSRAGALDLEITRTPAAELRRARNLPRSARSQCPKGPPGLPACALERLGSARLRLEDALEDEAGVLVFSPDGKQLAAGCSERLGVFDLPSGRQTHKLPCCMAAPMVALFSPDGRRLAVTPYVQNTQIWDLKTGLREAEWSYSARVLAASADGRLWAGADRQGRIRVGDRAGHQMRELPLEDLLPVNRLAFSPDGGRLLALRASQLVDVFDVQRGQRVWSLGEGERYEEEEEDEGEEGEEEGAEDEEAEEVGRNPASPVEQILLWAGFDAQGRVTVTTIGNAYVHLADGSWSRRPLGLAPDDGWGTLDEVSEPCSADGQVCALRSDEVVHLGRVAGKPAELKVGAADRIALDGTGRLMALARDEDLILWDLARGEQIGPAPAPAAQAPLAFSRGGLLLTRHEKEIRLQRPGDAKGNQGFGIAALDALLSADGRTILAVEEAGLTRLAAPNGARKLLFKGRFASNLALSDDGKRAAGVVEGPGPEELRLRALDVRTGKTLFVRAVPAEERDSKVALSSDGRRLARTAGNFIDLWALPGGRKPVRIDVEHEVQHHAFSPDGKLLIAGGDSHLDIYQAATGTYVGHLGDHANVQSFDFAAGGALVVTGGLDQLVRVFDLKHRRLLAVLSGHDRWVFSVSVSDTPPRAASLDAGGTILIWDLSAWVE